MKNYTKFVFVRHPLERLLSAFKNKFESDTPDAANFKRGYAVEMMRFSRDEKDIPKTGNGMEFWEFLNFLSSTESQWYQEHWALYNNLCHLCSIDYDIIGKYESLEDDSNYVLDIIGASSKLRFPKFVPSKTTENLIKYYNKVPNSIKSRILDIFNIDFEMFEYNKFVF